MDGDFLGASLRYARLQGALLRSLSMLGEPPTRLTGADLTGVDLSGALYEAGIQWPQGFDPEQHGALKLGPGEDLRGVNLQGAHLFRVNLQGANLDGVNLQGANLESANLQGANLRKADLSRTEMVGTNMKGADLCYADLRSASLLGTDFKGAKLRYANLQGTGLEPADEDLGANNFLGADLTGAVLSGAVYENSTRWPKGFDPQRQGAVRE
jgi:uncharacterized protein YjbI with pentapeptide repeats